MTERSYRIQTAIFAFYVFMIVFTFGYSFTHQPSERYSSWQQKEVRVDDELKVLTSVGCALLWPLYWSVRVWQ